MKLGKSGFWALFLFALVCALAAGAGSSSAQTARSLKTSVSNASSLSACELIAESEIATIQGVSVQQTQPSHQKQGNLDISQCYYAAMSADGRENLSVYLQLIRDNPKDLRREALKEFWETRFERDRNEKDQAEREEEEEKIDAPVRVAGIGDEAFWLGTSRGGALYVLTKDKVLRVTVGGADVRGQIEKSKTLAKKALRRLV